jgi:hypothetical protein
METTYSTARETSEVAPAKKISQEGKISKKALIGFVSGASIVFSLAVYYCMSTEHVFEGVVLIVAFTLIGIFAASLYRSFR